MAKKAIENANKLPEQYIPKAVNFDLISQKQINEYYAKIKPTERKTKFQVTDTSILQPIILNSRQFDLSTSGQFWFSNDFNIQFRLLREEVVSNQPRDKVGKKIVNTAMSGMLYLTDVFEHIIDGLYESSFP